MYPTKRNYDSSEFYSLAGRIMGGGSSVNMMSIPRPIKADLDIWAAQGNPDWSWDKVLPVLKRIESDQDFPHSPIHGNSGPIYVKRRHVFDAPLSEPEQALLEVVTHLGLPRFNDQNDPNPYGIAPTARNIRDGKRQSSAVAYLGPARQRANLTIVGAAQVTSLILHDKKAAGVRYRKDDNEHTASADKVVLSAGVYHSPQILMLSGIGPRGELERHGIPVVQPLDAQALFQKRSGARAPRFSYHPARHHQRFRHRRYDRIFMSPAGADQSRSIDVAKFESGRLAGYRSANVGAP